MLGDPKGNLGELEGTLTYYQEMQHTVVKMIFCDVVSEIISKIGDFCRLY